jgi:polysaccharide deacetylase
LHENCERWARWNPLPGVRALKWKHEQAIHQASEGRAGGGPLFESREHPRALHQGRGVIFMLHQVRSDPAQEFEPNRILRVTPDFLDSVIESTLEAGFDVISLDDVPHRLEEGSERPFAAFTLDDGYRDNREFAYPIFKRHSIPFTIFVSSDFADGNPELWWLTLEEVLRLRTSRLG